MIQPVHTDGQHNSHEDEQDGIIRITNGYSRDHRPDLNQLVLQLICEQQAGIPLLMQTLSGNKSDKDGFRETIQAHIEQLKTDFKLEYIVADSALYVAETLKEISNIWWISRVPETLNLTRDIIDAVAPNLMSKPDESAYCSLGVVYADVRQRWLVIYSPEANKRAKKSVDKHLLKLTTSELKSFEALCKQEFACEADARKAAEKFEKDLRATFLSDVQITKSARFRGKGRPAQGREPDFYAYNIAGSIASDLQNRNSMLQRKSCFIIATNQLDCAALPDEEMITAYKKDQQKVERGFRFLKDPLFMAATLFLKSPERIMALMMVMTLCLLVYAALERRIRQALQVNSATFVDQKGKPTANPTAR